jgi:hypothetical protein
MGLVHRLFDFAFALAGHSTFWIGLILLLVPLFERFTFRPRKAVWPDYTNSIAHWQHVVRLAGIAAIAFSGFQTFDHVSVKPREVKNHGAQLVFSSVDITPHLFATGKAGNQEDSGREPRAWFTNTGTLDAIASSGFVLPVIEERPLNAEEQNDLYQYVIKRASERTAVSSNHIQPGQQVFYKASNFFTLDKWTRFMQSHYYFYLFGAITYRDRLVDEDQFITTHFCAMFIDGDLKEWKKCGPEDKILPP